MERSTIELELPFYLLLVDEILGLRQSICYLVLGHIAALLDLGSHCLLVSPVLRPPSTCRRHKTRSIIGGASRFCYLSAPRLVDHSIG